MTKINTILFATDFSERTENALIYTLNLAEKLSSKIVYYHTFQETNNEEKNKIEKAEVSKRMQRMINSVAEINPKLKFDSIILPGDFTEHIESIIKKESIDLIVIGSKEIGWQRPFVAKRKTGKVIEISSCPVLMIPEHFTFKPLQNIVFLTNYYDSDIEDILYLEQLAKTFNATINVINIEEPQEIPCKKVSFEFEKEVRRKIENANIMFHFFKGDNIEKIVNLYSSKNKIDLLSMSTRHRNKLEKFYDPSFTETIAYDTKIPLLTFHIRNVHIDKELF